MNNTIKELFDRKSVRAFSEEPITEEEKRLILESAIQAPTAGNMVLYSIIDIQDQQLKDELAIRCDHQPFIAKAPLVLIFAIDYQKWYDIINIYCEGIDYLEESDFLLSAQDCLIAAQNAVVAAESMGIGSCYIGDILENYEINRELLNLPHYVVPFGMVVFGRPTQQQKDRIKPKRFELEDIVHVNTYTQKTKEETIQMFEKQTNRQGEELEKYIKAFAKRKFYTEFRYEMNRSCKSMLQNWLEKDK